MNAQKLQGFIDLVRFDQNLFNIEKKIKATEEKIQKISQQLEATETKVAHKVDSLQELKKQLDLQELNVKAIQDKESHQIKVVEQATNSKEYDAASKELESIQVQRDQDEKQLMAMYNDHEKLEKEVAAVKQEQEKEIQSINEEISQEKESLQSQQTEFDTIAQQRDAKVANVPVEWMDSYDNMRGKVDDPVVPVSQDSCSACFYLISSKDLQTLQKGDLVQCKDCYRFLYVDSASAEK